MCPLLLFIKDGLDESNPYNESSPYISYSSSNRGLARISMILRSKKFWA
jgi:hypothetical protein